MSATVKKSAIKKASPAVVVTKNLKDYSNDQLFVRKAKAMEAVLKKHGLPNSLG